MPRIEARVHCTLPHPGDANEVGRAIAEAIKSLTGNPCQTIASVSDLRGGLSNRMQMYAMRQRTATNNIGLMPPPH